MKILVLKFKNYFKKSTPANLIINRAYRLTLSQKGSWKKNERKRKEKKYRNLRLRALNVHTERWKQKWYRAAVM